MRNIIRSEMRFPRNTAVLGLSLTFGVTVGEAFATSSNKRAIQNLGFQALKNRSFQSINNGSIRSVNNKGSSSMGMFFSNLFGSPTPSVIDYTTLDYPGNEMGKVAQDNKVIMSCERKPNLEAATFAGGCFWGLELGKLNPWKRIFNYASTSIFLFNYSTTIIIMFKINIVFIFICVIAYQRVPGVEYTAVGYTQGPEENPTYSQVCSGGTGHTEAVCVLYDPNECSYEALLDTFFQRVNPTTVNGQGNGKIFLLSFPNDI